MTPASYAAPMSDVLPRIRPQTPDHREYRLTAPDGRTLAVAEWGDPTGIPVISHHGTPGSRISYWQDGSIDARHGLRRITFDRAGYGESTRNPGRSIADVVPDVATIADALGIDRFVAVGGSGGGPHVLATAALLGERVMRCMAVVSLAPIDAGFDLSEGMNAGNVEEFRAAMEGEAAFRPVAEREAATTLQRLREGRVDWLGDSYEMSDADREEMAKDLEATLDDFEHSLAHGVDGWVDDMLAAVKPWGFDLDRVTVPLQIRYGRTDNLVPPRHGDWLAARLPHADVVVTEAGHLAGEAALESIYRWLATGRRED